MAYPKQKEIEIPLLTEIGRAGGEVRPRDIYDKVSQHFPQLTEEDLERRMESYPSINKWHNKVQWARQALINKGEIDGSVYGVWKITDLGRQRVSRGLSQPSEEIPLVQQSPEEVTLLDLQETHENAVRTRLLDRLNNLTPQQFEHFARQLLEVMGFSEIIVTQQSHDGGIDGYGKLRQGIVKIDAAFQCKRWSGTVPRPEIDRFRGAISGQFDQGIFFTTSKFSREASEASIRRGAVPILMVDGERIVEIMIKNGIGISRRPLYLLDVDEEFFAIEEL